MARKVFVCILMAFQLFAHTHIASPILLFLVAHCFPRYFFYLVLVQANRTVTWTLFSKTVDRCRKAKTRKAKLTPWVLSLEHRLSWCFGDFILSQFNPDLAKTSNLTVNQYVWRDNQVKKKLSRIAGFQGAPARLGRRSRVCFKRRKTVLHSQTVFFRLYL